MGERLSANETMVVSSTGGHKAGNNVRGSLIPTEVLSEIAEHYGVGALKYDDNNWQKGYDWSRSYDALCRHLWAFWGGEDIDAETGSKHIVAVAWHAIALSWFMDNHPDFDDRASTARAKAAEVPAIKPWLVLKDESGLSGNAGTVLDGIMSISPEPLANWERALLRPARRVARLTGAERDSMWVRDSTRQWYWWNPNRTVDSMRGVYGAWDVYENGNWCFAGTAPGYAGNDTFTEVVG